MDLYRFAVYLGFTGLACMALLGVSHIGGSHHHGGNTGGHNAGSAGAHGGHGGLSGHGAHGVHGSHGAPQTHGHAAPGHASHGHAPHGHAHLPGGMERAALIMGFLSPRVLFSLSLGFGASGVLLRQALPVEPARMLAAMVGAVLWEKLILSQVWNLWMGFASKPARTLESAVFEEAVAIMNFDAQGCGLVSIDLDGHEMRVLAQLQPTDLAAGLRVRTGDQVLVEAVDAARNTCVVSAISAAVSSSPEVPRNEKFAADDQDSARQQPGF